MSNWPRNRLLLALPSTDLAQLTPELEQICCEREQVLMDADSALDLVFFPDSGVVSAVAVYADGSIIGDDAVLPRSDVRLRPSLSRAGPCAGGVQRGAQPQAAVSALAAHDA